MQPNAPLDESEVASLWSMDSDRCAQPAETIAEATTSSDIQQLAACTDITFKRPPDTAARWTAHDFSDLKPGNSSTSVYPPGATLTDAGTIADAHASMFSVQPSTRLHRGVNDEPLYIAPAGTVRALIDYRVRVPALESTPNGTRSWTLTSTGVSEVRLLRDGELIADSAGSQTPLFRYETTGAGPANLTVEADIRVTLRGTASVAGENQTRITTTVEMVTVSDTIPVIVYEPTISQYTARYPTGETGIALSQYQPWHGYHLDTHDGERVRGVWRYYTARDLGWDELVHSRRTGETRVASAARPVYVHAYPSEIGPRTEPVRDGPTRLQVWGRQTDSPAAGFPDSISVGVVERPYTESAGIALRTGTNGIERVRVLGIVRGVDTTVDLPPAADRRNVRESALTVDVISQTESNATLRIELVDARTGAPIRLTDETDTGPVAVPINGETREGYVTVNGERVTMDEAGVGRLVVTNPGSYSVRYHPGSWLSHDPAYTGATASVSWHPLLTITGWVNLLVDVVWWSIPFLVVLFAGIRLGSFLKFNEYR